MNKIHFFSLDRKPTLRNRKLLKDFITSLFIEEKNKLISLSYIFCSDDHLLTINRDFLKHDYYTDIITFDLGSIKGGIEGEIYISVDRVKDNASQMGVSFTNELHRVMFHGALHLCGYKDKSKAQAHKMREMEDKYLQAYLT